MKRYFKRNFVFAANRYEEWQGGHCINRGYIDCSITAEFDGDRMRFFLSDVDELNIHENFEFEMDGSTILGDRIQYVHSTSDFNPAVPMICHIFVANGTIDYVRFAMTNPDRIIEFYGELEEIDQPNSNDIQYETAFVTAQSIMNELNSYGMLTLEAIMERAVKLYNDNCNVQNLEQARSIVEALKLFTKCNELDFEEQHDKTSAIRPKILMFIALCNFKINNIDRAYIIAKKALDAIDNAIEDSPFIGIPRSYYGEETINELIYAIEDKYSDSIKEVANYGEIDENAIDTAFLDSLSANCNNSSGDTSKDTIKALINAISNIQNEFTQIGERNGDVMLAFKNNQLLEMYKLVLYFAWEKYKYGWHSDFWKEGDSMFEYMMFEMQPTNMISDLLKTLKESSPFKLIERNGAITNGLITIYEDLLKKINDGIIKL